jgi:hypothetical protein
MPLERVKPTLGPLSDDQGGSFKRPVAIKTRLNAQGFRVRRDVDELRGGAGRDLVERDLQKQGVLFAASIARPRQRPAAPWRVDYVAVVVDFEHAPKDMLVVASVKKLRADAGKSHWRPVSLAVGI